jgi:hypothetical protein
MDMSLCSCLSCVNDLSYVQMSDGCNGSASHDLCVCVYIYIYICNTHTQKFLFFSLDSVDIHHDAAAVETRTAPYGSTVVMDCRTDLEPPVDFKWSKQGGALPRDSSTRDVS